MVSPSLDHWVCQPRATAICCIQVSSCQFLLNFRGEGRNFVALAESGLQHHPSDLRGSPLCGGDQGGLQDHQEQAHAQGGGQDGHLELGESGHKARKLNPSKSWTNER